MATPDAEVKHDELETEVADMDIKEEQHDDQKDVDMVTLSAAEPVKKERSASASGSATPKGVKRQYLSPIKDESMAQSPVPKTEVVGGDVELRLDEGERPRLVRKQSQKITRRPPELFTHLPDATERATSAFSVLRECVYANKHMGTTDHALECDCAEEWGKHPNNTPEYQYHQKPTLIERVDAATETNNACDDDSDCINRATKMECVSECSCGSKCQNRRFQRKEWADVSVIQTEKKGFGLRADDDLTPHQFIFEYIGEVIGEASFRKRMSQYDEEGIKHFYFMSLNKGEFVDATKKGNLGRFCNHSCNPNCYVDKWVVGDRLRMGIFAERKIRAGEELTFNYNVDRYGAEPQPCYCGENNCTGYIGGKTQTERATKLSQAIIEALGIDDADAWDVATAKKPRKKKASEDDEEYVNNIEPRGLDEEGVNKVMSSLMQCKEKWIAVKLLSRIQRADDDKVRNRVVRFHGYRILKTALTNFEDDVNVCLQILDVLDKMPRLTRNKIQDSNIEEAVQKLTENEDERVVAQSRTLLDAWSKLEVGYRIPRVKRDPKAVAADRRVDRSERRQVFDRRRSRSRSKSRSPEPIQAPTGPRSNAPQRANPFGGRPPPRFRPPPPSGPLPPGWFEATAPNGALYYYNNVNRDTSWERPTAPAANVPPPPPPKAVTDQQMLQDLIKNIVSSAPPAKQLSNNATPADTPKKERREDKWRSLPEEKQKKMYESTLQPHIMHVVGKYKHKLAKDDLKRWAKEFAKKMVESDFKKGRVEDPSKISDKQVKAVKKHAQDFFDKAVKKKEEADKRRNEKKAKQEDDGSRTPAGSPPLVVGSPMDKDDEVHLSDDEAVDPDSTPAESNQSTDTLKRRMDDMINGEDDDSVAKKLRTDAPPPPPPPPPPTDYMDTEDGALAPGEDVSGSFTHEAIASVHAASMEEMQAAAGADSGFSFKGAASRPSSALGNRRLSEATQTATPPTTGSPDLEDAERVEKATKREAFTGVNPERLQRLGLDGASE